MENIDYTEEELQKLLLRRTERFQEEIALQAPRIVWINEVRLIKQACEQLLRNEKNEINTVELQ